MRMGRRERGAVSALGSAAVTLQPARLRVQTVQAAPDHSVSSCHPVIFLCSRVCDSSDIVAVFRGVTKKLRCSTLVRACLLSSRFGPVNPLFPFSTLVFTRFHTQLRSSSRALRRRPPLATQLPRHVL